MSHGPGNDWFAVWCENQGGDRPPYVLLLVHRRTDGGAFLVIDPREGDRVVYRAPAYDAVRSWLSEDESTLARGRTPLYDL